MAPSFFFGGPGVWMCNFTHLDFPLGKGQLHISYNVTRIWRIGAEVDFWFVDDQGLLGLESVPDWDRCTLHQRRFAAITHDFRSIGYDSIVDIPSDGTYHIVFVNSDPMPAQVTLHVDYVSPSVVLSVSEVQMEYSTQTSTITTELMKPVSQPVGLGMPFFSGIGLVAVAVIAIVVAMRRKGGIAPSPTTFPVARPSPPKGPQDKFCMNCGAPLPLHAPYCSECGSKQ